MGEKLTNSFVEKLGPGEKRRDIRDTLIPKLILRVEPSGKKSYLVDFTIAGRRSSEKIGDAAILTVAQAREKAREFLAAVTLGDDPSKKRNGTAISSLGDLIDTHYEEWAMVNRKSGKKNLALIRSSFGHLMEKHPEEITLLEIEKWRVQLRRKGNVRLATINRKTTALKALLNWGVRQKLLESNPLLSLQPYREMDSDEKIRYLDDDERRRLIEAIDAREETLRLERDNHNAWLAERGLPLKTSLRDASFADHLKPAVLLALNTGLRRGTMFALRWEDVNFDTETITVRGEVVKAGKTLTLPMNRTVLDTLRKWRKQTGGKGYLFEYRGKPIRDCRSSWGSVLRAAEITNFRWHDFRHDFASQLVMRGVDLNTVRELLGHSDIKMTLRYAHLAPNVKKRAVELLG